MRVLHRPEMGVMCVEYSFPCEGWFIGEQHFSGENGICSTLFKIPLCKSNTRCIITRLKCLDTLHVIRMHFVFSKNPTDAETENPDRVRYTSRTPVLDLLASPVPDVVHSLRSPESLLIVPDSWQIFERNLFQLTSGAALQKNYGWEYTS
ncbi:hypothetical protein AVEN_161714-1 [Araneus ventricosus]|uniref:Uncharacterized protein n=1 Tax=Araneus ventricosus TaxID=182803 RepID=A0A4Y2PBK9_ARAVE|nr:hypothetical protein AVEN_161714-1 [Araneus ventricosus]